MVFNLFFELSINNWLGQHFRYETVMYCRFQLDYPYQFDFYCQTQHGITIWFNPILSGGGALSAQPFLAYYAAPEPIKILIWNFLTFPKYQIQIFWKIFLSFGLNPIGRGGGVLKKGGIEKMIFELGLQNTIFSFHKNKLNSKVWNLYLKNWASDKHFCRSSRVKISKWQNLSISKSQ